MTLRMGSIKRIPSSGKCDIVISGELSSFGLGFEIDIFGSDATERCACMSISRYCTLLNALSDFNDGTAPRYGLRGDF